MGVSNLGAGSWVLFWDVFYQPKAPSKSHQTRNIYGNCTNFLLKSDHTRQIHENSTKIAPKSLKPVGRGSRVLPAKSPFKTPKNPKKPRKLHQNSFQIAPKPARNLPETCPESAGNLPEKSPTKIRSKSAKSRFKNPPKFASNPPPKNRFKILKTCG